MKTISITIVCVIIGVILGYGIGSLIYVPKINAHQIQITELSTKVTQLTNSVAELTGETSRLNQTVLEQSTTISTIKTENGKLQSDLTLAQQNVTTYKSQVTNLESQVSGLSSQVTSLRTEGTNVQTRLNKILGINVIQHYDWLNSWTWELSIPLSLYIEYKERPRPTSIPAYVNLAKDPKDDNFIDQMVQFINRKAQENRFNELDKINFVINFVQSLPYTVDSVTELADEYPRYPIETLFDRGGDCEDTSILTAAILDKMGYDVALINPPKHMAIGLALPNPSGRYYTYNGKKYYYVETTGEGWKIGEMPREYINTGAYVYPLR